MNQSILGCIKCEDESAIIVIPCNAPFGTLRNVLYHLDFLGNVVPPTLDITLPTLQVRRLERSTLDALAVIVTWVRTMSHALLTVVA